MGELVRRLDYERRSKSKSLLVDGTSGQRINKEYTPQVRAANEMEDRKKDFYVKRNELHIKNYMDRHDYERKMIERFHAELDVKSQYFDSKKFQMLQRAQSANARLQKRKERQAQITEILPRKYYINDSTKSNEVTTVEEDENENENENEASPTKPKGPRPIDPRLLVFGVKRVPTKTKPPPKRGDHLKFIPPGITIKRRPSMQVKEQETKLLHRISSAPASLFRQRSMPEESKASAFLPGNVQSARLKRRESRTSLSSSETSMNSDEEEEINSRSFRLLREAFKKKRAETPNPAQQRLDQMKTDHKKQASDLMEDVRKKFDEIIKDAMFTTVY